MMGIFLVNGFNYWYQGKATKKIRDDHTISNTGIIWRKVPSTGNLGRNSTTGAKFSPIVEFK